MSARDILSSILEEQKKTNKLLQDIFYNKEKFDESTTALLFSFPDHIRKTIVALGVNCKGYGTAGEIAEITKRARAVESGYLNQLVLMGHLNKERRGRRVYFFLNEEDKEKGRKEIIWGVR